MAHEASPLALRHGLDRLRTHGAAACLGPSVGLPLVTGSSGALAIGRAAREKSCKWSRKVASESSRPSTQIGSATSIDPVGASRGSERGWNVTTNISLSDAQRQPADPMRACPPVCYWPRGRSTQAGCRQARTSAGIGNRDRALRFDDFCGIKADVLPEAACHQLDPHR
jgi:hypothetical protein